MTQLTPSKSGLADAQLRKFKGVKTMHKELAKVRSFDLFIEDHGIFTCFLQLDYESGSSQGFGGYSLDGYNKDDKRREGSAAGTDFLLRILQTFGVERFEQLEGKVCYALREDQFEPIKGIEVPSFGGENRTFLISDWQKRWFPKD